MMLTYLEKGDLVFQTDPLGPGLPRQFFSKDYGRTWPERRPLQPAANGGIDGHHPDITGFFGAEGNAWVDRGEQGLRIAMIGYNYDKSARWPRDPANGILRWSKDGGRTWAGETIQPAWRFEEKHGGKTFVRGVSEGSLVRAKNGWLVAALRTDIPARFLDGAHNDNLEGTGVSISKDDGKTWGPIQMLFEAGRHHAHLLRLADGRLVMTLIVRANVQGGKLASYRRGVDALVSKDNGQTWDLGRRYVLDEYNYYDGDKWFSGECGHLSSLALDDGTILTCYGNYLAKGISLVRWRPAKE
jgi:hypothetical protein